MAHPANAGLKWAEEKLEPFKTKYPGVSYADLYQVSVWPRAVQRCAREQETSVRHGVSPIARPWNSMPVSPAKCFCQHKYKLSSIYL